MPFPGLDRFKANMRAGGARASLFEVLIPFPGLAGAAAQDAVRFRCRSAAVPDSRLSEIQMPYMGRKLKYAGNRDWPNWVVTVIEDEDFAIRRAVESWQSDINSHESNLATRITPNGLQGYGRDGIITQLGKEGGTLRRWKFVEMWPVSIGQIQYDWQNETQIVEYQVEFAYQWQVPEIAFATNDPAVNI